MRRSFVRRWIFQMLHQFSVSQTLAVQVIKKICPFRKFLPQISDRIAIKLEFLVRQFHENCLYGPQRVNLIITKYHRNF